MKKIIFFDGDGTLWYPRKTKFSAPPWVVYKEGGDMHAELKRQMLMPNVKKTLKSLKKRGIKLAIISTQPDRTKRERDARLHAKLKHFGIAQFFDYVEASKAVAHHAKPDSKDNEISKILKRTHLPKSSALMIGDQYGGDYLPAKKAGISAVMIDGFTYKRNDRRHSRVRRKIHDIGGIFKYL
ncbi:MAG: HAD-IIIC family phosphatase [Candidatus Micrarchaeia archaeon]